MKPSSGFVRQTTVLSSNAQTVNWHLLAREARLQSCRVFANRHVEFPREENTRHSRLCNVLCICSRNRCGLRALAVSRWHVGAPLLGTSSSRLAGVLLIVGGIPVLLDSFARLALQGLGTPAPIFPTRHLVVSGFFRYLRNPMYVAVVSLILGQGLFFGSIRLLEFGIAVCMGFYLFVLIYEEPVLRKSYGLSMKNSARTFHGGFRACDPGGANVSTKSV